MELPISNDDDDTEDDANSKMNFYFTSEIRNCLDLARNKTFSNNKL